MIEWIKSRVKEPSTWTAAAVILIGIGAVISATVISITGIIVAVFGIVLKETGIH
jgi:hypothetical protein|tara:strand:- start:502 stop:666 length:165 start_codon:yes stop_codon:yes gene_type:complete